MNCKLPPEVWRMILTINRRRFATDFFRVRHAMLKNKFARTSLLEQYFGGDMYIVSVMADRELFDATLLISRTINNRYIQTRVQGDLIFEMTAEGNQIAERTSHVFRLY